MLKVIGAGLSRTGTLSLHGALEMLGLRGVHFDDARLNDVLDGTAARPDFRRYDDVEAVTDLPCSLFYRELMQAYPDAKVVLTVRDVEQWWKSVEAHFTYYRVTEESRMKHKIGRLLGMKFLQEDQYHVFRRRLRYYAYGSPAPKEFLYKKRYVEHNAQVVATVPADRLLVMDISAGDGWEKLCGFLDLPIPNQPFPHAHSTLG